MTRPLFIHGYIDMADENNKTLYNGGTKHESRLTFGTRENRALSP